MALPTMLRLGVHNENMKLTICIPTYNAGHTIRQVLDRVSQQDIELQVLIYDNCSNDGTPEMIEAMIKRQRYKFGIKLIKSEIRMMGAKTVNIPYVRFKLCEEVETDYLFFLDSDVLIEPNCLKILFDEFINDKEVGLLGMRYEPKADHVQMGATLMKSSTAKKIKWRWDKDCDCKNCIKSLEAMELKARYNNDLMAKHLRWI